MIPREIRERGAAAVGHYLESIEKKGAEKLNEARIIILGDKGAGKTSLAVKLKNPDAEMPEVEDSTAGVDVSHWKPKGEDVNIRIWDFAGHTITHTVHRFFLSERCAYVVVCDGRTERDKNLEYWLDFVKNYGDNSGVFILVNKRDEHLPKISINNLKERYNIKGYSAFSIKEDSKALSDFCDSLKAHIRDKPSWSASVIPRDAFQVKEELEGLFAGEDRESITKEDFDSIAEKFQVDDAEELLKNLHALGVCLWYEGMEKFDTLVLNPEWISHGVYQVINWVHGQKKYSLKLEDFIAVFKDNASRFPKEKHEFFLPPDEGLRFGLRNGRWRRFNHPPPVGGRSSGEITRLPPG